MAQFGLSLYDSSVLTASRAMADYFEACVGTDKSRAKKVANWLLGETSRLLNATGKEVQDCPVRPAQLVELLELVDRGEVSGPAAKAVFEEMFRTGKDAGVVLQEKGLVQISDGDELVGMVREVLAANPQAVADYKKGKAPALSFLLGQAMRLTKGRANPAVVRQLLEKELAKEV